MSGEIKKYGKGRSALLFLFIFSMMTLSAVAGYQFHKHYKGIEIRSFLTCTEHHRPKDCVNTGPKWFE